METNQIQSGNEFQIFLKNKDLADNKERNLDVSDNAYVSSKCLENQWPMGIRQNITPMETHGTVATIGLTYNPNTFPVKIEHENSETASNFETFSVKSPTLTTFDGLGSSSSSTTHHIADILKADRLMSSQYALKKRGRKKISEGENMSSSENTKSTVQSNVQIPQPMATVEYQQADSKQMEVIKAAKSLFSKRTRTLYHWMYPNAPKQQLKTAVANSWDTLGLQEKQFYISQVLGRFGFPQCSLMVNPQLGSIRSVPPLLPLPSPSLQSPEETRSAVSSILINEANADLSWQNARSEIETPKPKRKAGRPPGSRNKRQRKDIIKMIQDDGNPEEFQDDPELCREFQQFKWALHMTDDK